MFFYLAKKLLVKQKWGDGYDLGCEDPKNIEKYRLDDEEENFMLENFVDETDKLCDALLDYGDYEYYDIKKCKILSEWLKKKIPLSTNKKYKDLYEKLLNFVDRAIEYDTGIAIEG